MTWWGGPKKPQELQKLKKPQKLQKLQKLTSTNFATAGLLCAFVWSSFGVVGLTPGESNKAPLVLTQVTLPQQKGGERIKGTRLKRVAGALK